MPNVTVSVYTLLVAVISHTAVAIAYNASVQIARGKYLSLLRTRQKTDLTMTKNHSRPVSTQGESPKMDAAVLQNWLAPSAGRASHCNVLRLSWSVELQTARLTEGDRHRDRQTDRQTGSERKTSIACREDDPQAALPRHRSRSK